ncbi:hypothetical protein G3A56_26675 (plasmid) [Rhizobium oryzihabitans]|uniref:Uncharacterized protein n=1 Tax=Rhizobium oryzihabitans TaxID=2267833 RepID=A0A7L5BRI6_9HYPH|nr:hypothetical protein [Rhizobium oryzihabitans]QCM08817.1 hypothetical protein CFBP6626_26230 [Agrobacterium tumefaciens]QIB41393.1 hypothetical protein G3A56_26675 [Rhizobium oryzihabitans]CUX67645.1 conserved hypothetical protein [Agrobacterium genomosp. 5 str. CFBP 6626]
MLFELIAAVVAGVAVAGVVSGLRWVSRGLLPKWIVPATGGIAMLVYAVWSEYTWYDRMTHAMPAGVVVTWKNEDQSFWRPWSYYRPVINRFTAVDASGVRRHPQQPDQAMVDVILAARWQTSIVVKAVFDCVSGRRTDLIGDKVTIAYDGAIAGAEWIALAADDPARIAVCDTR